MNIFKWFVNALVTISVLTAAACGGWMAFSVANEIVLNSSVYSVSVTELIFYFFVAVIGMAITVTSVFWALIAFFTGEGLLVGRFSPGLYWRRDGVGVFFSRTELLWRWSEEAQSLL